MILVHTTVPDDGTAESMARELVEERVAACVNANPVSSTYRWDGEVVEEDEVALEIKTALPYDEVRERVEEIHPYDVPCIIRYDTEANDDYADWVRDATRAED
ncbi:MAG: periplasmic divalent cation tolerance protein [Methanobacteriota archaeon]|jgi:periplasmic divalent cation tolerance protein|uniref:Divalent-cation tolerance protein CutA n=1 Tax=Halorutilus salinus TaxID=2487751 RepID=A0A9Q4GJ19_9EURY|nr:divalent-cation tolerance protein CutA [Halorutilus salinus]MCX2818811.1 divalent-cation tolerance protein CutA [Halorutilus salinus]